MHVLDTNVLVAALRSSRGASHALLQAVSAGRLPVIASEALFLEYQAVLTREEHEGHIEGAATAVLDMLATRLLPVTIRFRWRPQLPDPDDDKVLECAINGRASSITTFNVTDFLPGASYFGIEVMRPPELLQRLRFSGGN